MATTRIMSLHIGKGRTVGKAISDIIDYVENPDKTDGGRLISSYQCDSRIADAEFLFAKRQYLARTGRQRGADDVIAYTIRQSFVPGEITPEEANRLGYELARRFTKGRHAFIVCTHVDKAYIHNHIIWNSTTLDHSRKFRDFLGSGRAVRRLNDTICVQNGYSIVANPKRQGKSYNKWLGSKPPCHRDQLRMAIDAALAQKPADLDALLKLLQEAGVTIKRRGKGISLQAPGRKGFIRLDVRSMGQEYDLTELLAVLAGEKAHTPSAKNIHHADPPKVNLLVDIQAKLQAGKGAGYARWASVFNLKQMAQTLNYLTEHGLLDYADLAAKAAEATERYNALSEKIKAAEQRMAEIAVLKTHIINYAKTREVYVAYRKAGYIAKFLDTDFVISTASYFQFQFEKSESDLSESFIEAVKQNDSFEEGGRLYTSRMLEEPFSTEHNAFFSYNKNQNGNPLVALYGADDFLLNGMEAVEGSIDQEKLKTGQYILLSVDCNDDGTVIENPNISVGDKVRINHLKAEELSTTITNSYDFIIMAKVRVNENTATTRNTGEARFYLPTEIFLPLCDNPHLVSFPFDVKEGTEAEMAEFLNSYIDSVEPSMDFESKATYTSSFDDLTSLIITIGGALSIIIGNIT